MTPEEEEVFSRIERTVRDSNIVTSGINVSGGFPDLPKATTSIDRLQNILKAHEDFKIVGGDNVTVAGSLKKGYAICSTCPEPSATGFPGIVPPPPVPAVGACCAANGDCSITTESDCDGDWQGEDTDCDPNPCPQPTGACCVGTDCTIETEDDCTGMGGTYQGDDTTCDPNPCAPTGACCKSEVCDIETQADCEGSGGVYQGDGTDCDPNPCTMESCGCVTPFSTFDLSPGKFRTYHSESSGTIDTVDSDPLSMFNIHTDWNSTTDRDCNGSCSCSGSGSSDGTLEDGSPYHCDFTFGNCGNNGTFIGGVSDCNYTPSCWTPGSNTSETSSSNTRTTRHQEWDITHSTGTVTTDWNAILDETVSDECIP